MRPLVVLLLILVRVLALHAQGDGIDGGFSKLSAKERSRIAKEEEREASSDTRFQALMNEAEELFRAGRYEDALERFTEARELRPYNVYPRVKIQDLQALIARRDAASSTEEDPVQEVMRPEPPRSELPVPPTVPQDSVEVVAPAGEAPKVRPPAPREVPPVRPAEGPVERIQMERRVALPTSQTAAEEGERIYKEGRAVVTERTVVQEGRPVVFRKVLHPWGEAMYFRDGLAIPERVWAETFGQR